METITYYELVNRVNLYRQGIMPTRTIQEWYNRRRNDPNAERVHCVVLCDDGIRTNPPDVENRVLDQVSDVNALTPGRLYEILCFKGQPFEVRYLYTGVSPGIN